ncbi:MAG: hypothetical protein KDD60_12720, partial [Bdellovibrionales bacterium]|nr:hypothetical protein [Bdellovibrionales bacterium]
MLMHGFLEIRDCIESARSQKQSSHEGERGVVLVIATIFTLVLMGAIAYFSYLVPVSKRESTRLRVEVDQICAELAAEPMITQDVYKKFFGRVSSLQMKHGSIKSAVLYLPLMQYQRNSATLRYSPEEYSSILEGGTDTEHVSDPAELDFDPGLCSGFSCKVRPSFGWGEDPFLQEDDDGTNDLQFPDSIALHSYYSGNFVGCEVKVDVGRDILPKFFGGVGDPEVVARVAYLRRPTNFHEESFKPDEFSSDFPAVNRTLPKVTVIIDPYVQTRSDRPRFSIPS